MTDERMIGGALKRELQRLSARVEMLERQAAQIRGVPVNLLAIEEGRVDLDVALDQLTEDVDAAINDAFARVALELKRQIAL